MAYVGTVYFELLDGEVLVLAEGSEDWERPGIDGHGARAIGLRGSPFTLRGTRWDVTETQSNSAKVAALALQSALVTVTDQWGRDHPNIKVDQVRVERRQMVLKDGEQRIELGVAFECKAI